MELFFPKINLKYFFDAKKAIRLVNGSRYNEHMEPIFKELCILPLDKLIEFFNLQFM